MVLKAEQDEERRALIHASLNGDWREDAACLGMWQSIPFFPTTQNEARPSTLQANYQMRKARAVCQECEVKEPCLLAALACYEHGIWADTDFEERQRLRAILAGRRTGPGPCPDCNSRHTLDIRGSNPLKARCLMCNYRWKMEVIPCYVSPLA